MWSVFLYNKHWWGFRFTHYFKKKIIFMRRVFTWSFQSILKTIISLVSTMSQCVLITFRHHQHRIRTGWAARKRIVSYYWTAIGNSVISTASMIVRKLFIMKGMTRITSTHFRFRPTGRITATISISIPIHAIRSRLILHMYRTKIHAVLMCTASHIKSRKEPQLTIWISKVWTPATMYG